MYRVVFLLLALLLTAADAEEVAGDGEDGPVYDHAEYIRLSEELEKLAVRNAWSGVDRMYAAIIGMGATPSPKDHLSGAHSARALGNVTGARFRLEQANQQIEDKEILDWLWDIDSNYGRVSLLADRGKVVLNMDVLPFNPDQRKAVEWAQHQISETGTFEGFLPQGDYKFGVCPSEKTTPCYDVEVVPRVQSVRIDMRTHLSFKDDKRKQKKNQRK
jgi:hypothetical protein